MPAIREIAERQAQEGTAREVERALGLLPQAGEELRRIGARGGHPGEAELRLSYPLARLAAGLGGEGGAQGRVALDQSCDGPHEGLRIQPSAHHPRRTEEVVGEALGRQLVEEPERLLAMG